MLVWLMLVNWRKEIRSLVNFVRMICPAVENAGSGDQVTIGGPQSPGGQPVEHRHIRFSTFLTHGCPSLRPNAVACAPASHLGTFKWAATSSLAFLHSSQVSIIISTPSSQGRYQIILSYCIISLISPESTAPSPTRLERLETLDWSASALHIWFIALTVHG